MIRGDSKFFQKKSKFPISSKNLSIPMSRKIEKPVSYMVSISQNRSFLVKMVKFGSFWDQNDIIDPDFRVGRNYFFLKTVSNVILVRFIG